MHVFRQILNDVVFVKNEYKCLDMFNGLNICVCVFQVASVFHRGQHC